MQAQRIISPSDLLSTPDPDRFPLTSPYAPDGTRLRPGGVYIRESERDQGVYSFDTQCARARDVLLRWGFYVAMVRVDSKTGSKVSRTGYKDVEQAVHSGLIEAVGVYMMQRWGRRASERLRIGEEFDKLGVVVIDAQRGEPDEPGMIRAVMAAYDEQFLRDQADRAVDNLPRVVRAGKHVGPTPIGYKRIYPQHEGYDRHASSVMVEHDVYGPLVRELFIRYGNGWITKKLARWADSLPHAPNPKNKNGHWDYGCIARILQRPVYKQYEDTEHGTIVWGRRHVGEWRRYQGERIEVEGRHPWLVDCATWERVQLRLRGPARTKYVTQRGNPPALLHGFLYCRGCGSAFTARPGAQSRGNRQRQYVCMSRYRAQSDCQEQSIRFSVADAAVLRELARLRSCPWEPQALERAAAHDPHAERRRSLQRELAREKADLQRAVDTFRAVGDVSKPVLDAFRASTQAISERIQALEAELTALPDGPIVDIDAAREVHEQLGQTEIADLLERSLDTGQLRRLLQVTITSARITERVYSGCRTVWARAKVDWTPEVELLLFLGLLTLAPEPIAPRALSKNERAAERARRYRAKKAAAKRGAAGLGAKVGC